MHKRQDRRARPVTTCAATYGQAVVTLLTAAVIDTGCWDGPNG